MIPVLIYLTLTFIGMGVAISKHGQPKTGKHDAFSSIIASLIIWIILYYGGFFDPLLSKI